MKVTVTKKQELGQPAEFKLYLDEIEYEFGLEASNKLTDAECNLETGIFANGCQTFTRGSLKVRCNQSLADLDFETCYPEDDMSAKQVAAHIVKVANMIRNKFAEMAPSTNETCTLELS